MELPCIMALKTNLLKSIYQHIYKNVKTGKKDKEKITYHKLVNQKFITKRKDLVVLHKFMFCPQ